MKHMIWVAGLALLLPGCISADYYDDMVRSVHEVDSLKSNDNRQDMQIRELEKRVDELQSRLGSAMQEQGVKVESASAEGVRVTLPQSVLFASGSTEINEEGRKVLASVAEAALKGSEENVRIVGHSDALPVGGELKNRFTDNWELSAARAASVARVLVWGEGVDQGRILVEGRGAAEPVADNATAEGRDQNRRIEIFIAG